MQKTQHNRKGKARRFASLLLAGTMILQCGEGAAVSAAADSEKPTYLKSSRIEAGKLPEGDCMYFGTASAELQEQGYYAVRVFREGNLDKKASVEVHTVDMTALYGKDYELAMEDVKLTEKDEDDRKTVLEKYVKGQYTASQDKEEDASSQQMILPGEAMEQLQQTAGDVLLPLEKQAAEKETAAGKTAAKPDSEETKKVSGELAAEKEAQTGKQSRQLSGEELSDQSIVEALSEDMVGNTMEALDYSASCKVEFAPGESEKAVTFRILEDEESEGNEGFSLVLAEPKNAQLYEVSTSAITIVDDEEKVSSKVSFGKKEYTAKDGTVEVTVKRTGAEYSVCDVDVMTVGDTAQAGEDYDAVNETISFAPYQMEQKIQISTYGSGKFDVKFTGHTGCDEGKITRTTVKIPEEKESAETYSGSKSGTSSKKKATQDSGSKNDSVKGNTSSTEKGKKLINNQPVSQTAKTASEQQFGIKINGRDYTVKYNAGDSTGTIMDEAYQPAVEAGVYYFCKSGNGWSYYQGGDDPTWHGWRKQYWDSNKQTHRLEYYSSWTGHKGYSGVKKDKIFNGLYFQYFVPDWEASNKSLGGNKTFVEVHDNTTDSYVSSYKSKNSSLGTGQVNGNLDRTQSNSPLVNDHDGYMSIKLWAEDNEKNKTPKCYADIHGVCAMYRRYTCSVSATEQSKNFLYDGKNYQSYKTMEVGLTAGAENRSSNKLRDFYANVSDKSTNMVFDLNYASVAGVSGKFGRLTGWKLKVDSGSSNVTVNYPQDFISWLKSSKSGRNSNKNEVLKWDDTSLRNEVSKVAYEGYSSLYASGLKEQGSADQVVYDGYFDEWINSISKGPITEGYGYYQKLDFTPVISYNDVKVEVLPATGGGTAYFNDSNLKYTGTGSKTVTYHQGDTLNLSATATAGSGYEIEGYEVSVNGGEYTTYRDNEMYFLAENPLAGYRIRPVVQKKKNCIEIQYEGDAEKHIQVEGLMNQSKLTGTEYEGKKVLQLHSGSSAEAMVAPSKGEYYTVKAYVKDAKTDSYGRVYKEESGKKYYYQIKFRMASGGKTYTTDYFPNSASSNSDDNVVKVSYVKSTTAPSKKTVTGYLLSACKPIVDTGVATKTVPLINYSASCGSNTQTLDKDNQWLPDTSSDVTNKDGLFTLNNVYGNNGDVIPVLMTDGVYNNRVVYVTLGSGSEVRMGETKIDYPSNAPAVSSVSFKYGKTANQNSQASTRNNLKILDDSLTVSAVVNTHGRKIKEAVFTVVTRAEKDDGTVFEERHEYRVQEKSGSPNVFECVFGKMPDELLNGDRLWVRLVDADQRLSEAGRDENGNPVKDEEGNVITGQYVPIEYPDVETGYVFSTENVLRQPQTYDLQNTEAVDIPVLGSALSSANTGLLTFGRTDWGADETGQNKGYTLQVGIDGLFGTQKTPSTKDKLDGYKDLQKKTKDAIKTKKQNAEDLMKNAAENGTEMKDSIYESAEISLTEEKKEMEAVKDAANSDPSSSAKEPTAKLMESKAWNVEVAVVLVFDFAWNPNAGDYTFTSGAVLIGGTYTYNKTIYRVIHSVPAFLNFTATVQGNILGSYTTSEGSQALTAGDFDSWVGNLSQRLSEPACNLDLMFIGKVQVGVGMCGVLSARGYASVKVEFDIPLQNYDGGGLLGITGGIGFDVLIMSINIDMFTATQGWGTRENASGFSFFGGLISSKNRAKKTAAISKENDVLLKKYSNNEVMTAHTYNQGTSDMSSFGKSSGKKKAGLQAVSVTTLLDNAAEHTRPQLISLGNGKKMIVFIGSRSEEELNSAALFYSVYDGTNWSEPKMVAEDSTVDSTPDVLKVNDKVVIAWADAGRTFAQTDTNLDKLRTMGISAAVYDINSGVMGDEVKIVDDQYFNLSPQLSADGTNFYCSYMKRDLSKAEKDEDLLNVEKVYSTMAYTSYDYAAGKRADEKFVDICHEKQTDPVVMDYNSVTTKVGEDTYLVSTYTIDEDENLNTNEDKELYLGITNVTKDRSYYPIRVTNDGESQSSPRLTEVNGSVYLSWMESGYIFHLTNATDLLNALFDTSDSTWNVTMGEDDTTTEVGINKQIYVDGYMTQDAQNKDWYKASAEKLGVNADVYEGTIYNQLAQGNINSDSENLSQREEMTTSISDYVLTGNGEDVYIYFTDFGEDNDSAGKEIYGARYTSGKVNDSEQENDSDQSQGENMEGKAGFSKAVQITKADKVIDELDLYMTDDNRVSAVSNYYDQWIDSNGQIQYGENKLVEIEFETTNSMKVDGDLINLPSELKAGEQGQITFSVVNDGISTCKGYDYTIAQVKGGQETEIAKGHSDTGLSAGEREEVMEVWDIPADLSDTEIKVTVTETGVDDNSPSVTSCKVPYESMLAFNGTEVVQENEKFYVSTTVTNAGNAAFSGKKAKLILLDNEYNEKKTYKEFDIPALKSGESKELKIEFTPLPGDYTSAGILELEINVKDGDNVIANSSVYTSSTVPVIAAINDGAESLALKAGATSKLKATVGPWENLAGNAVFYSSDNSVATVNDKGEVTGQGNGTATIGVYYPEARISDTIKVAVSGASNPPANTGSEVPDAKLSSVKLNKNNQPVIKWKKLSSVTGYKVYRSTKKSSGFKKIATVKKGKTSYTDKKAKANKKYYYRVRAYKSTGGTNAYGGYSAVKSVKTLKLTAPKIKVGKVKNGKVTVTFKKRTGTNAVIYQKKKGKWKKVSVVGSGKFKKNKGKVKIKMKKGGTLQAKTCLKKKGKTYYSPASKSVKVKK